MWERVKNAKRERDDDEEKKGRQTKSKDKVHKQNMKALRTD